MSAQLLDGRTIAARIKAEVKEEIRRLGFTPGLAAILVGADPASHLYVGLKEKACAEVGIHFEKYLFFATESQKKIVSKINELNKRSDIHAILVQMPLPQPQHEDTVIRAIDPKKDVDGFHPENLNLLIAGTPRVVPGVARGIFELIRSSGESMRGARAALLANSTTFAAPVEYLLEEAGATVHIVLASPELESVTTQLRDSDIVVVAIGRPRAVTGAMIKPGATIIDVGTNRLDDNTLVGDVD
ncbi:bifunctional 5,10-methylenetetrahydrofolate dehydrogenase/5,10-methenyltetrahydrofolate cyclohydrolase, partial [Candidatus Uhrbacteria bacterium]|nr:bifunctional 5,10-methylenetetrahydrofolate dehydrogenase/5,10-methenyltetrahydrofolate cyclohydrolase [Candidatus Uhrbacteria bacterium]